jgi:hypothetical protein
MYHWRRGRRAAAVVTSPRFREGRLFVRFYVVRRQALADRPLGQMRQARVAGIRPVIARMRRQQPVVHSSCG